MADVRGALTGLTGVLPRRAVALGDGRLGERRDHPELSELTSVSLACEALRRASNEPVYSRHTPHLVRQCLDDNDPGAWRALLDDMTTGDMDRAVALETLAAEDCAARFIACLITAQSGVHLWLVVCVLHRLWPDLAPPMTQRLSHGFQCSFDSLLKAVIRKTWDLAPDLRAGCISALGALMVWTTIPVPDLAAMMGACVTGAHDDALRLFLHAPIEDITRHAPELVQQLLSKAERAHQGSRYPSCALLAAMSREQLAPHADRVLRLAHAVLDTGAAQGTMDVKLLLACGALVKSVAPPRTLEASLAHALCCVTYAQCNK